MEGFSSTGMRPYIPRVRRDFDDVPRGNSRRALAPSTLANQQPISGVEFLHRAGRYRPGRSLFSSAGSRICRDMEGFLIQG